MEQVDTANKTPEVAIADMVRVLSGARGVAVLTIDGTDGSNFVLQANKTDIELWLSMAEQLRVSSDEMIQTALETAKGLQEEAGLKAHAAVTVDDGEEGEYKPLPIQELANISKDILLSVRKQTQTWEEGVFALSLAIGGMVAMRRAQAGDEDSDAGKLRAKEILDEVLDRLHIIAVEGAEESISVIKVK